MPNTRATVKQSELTRYAKAMQAAEIDEWRVVIRPDGSHEIIVSKAGAGNGPNPWDEVL